MTNECPKCNFSNPPDTNFCGKCATPLPKDEEALHTKTIETPHDELTSGSTFAGRYQIIEELGKGGMGRVYKVFDTKIKEKIALKLIKPEIASDKRTIERFTDELKLARKITHKNVGRMFDINEDKGRHYITMEYVEGQDLRGLIRQSGQLAVGTALAITKQVCQGLGEAHSLGVVHRDLKPSNIMIDRDGKARIMDFGIAKSVKARGVTGEGVQIGTPAYMSPEQAQGLGVDSRTDIWSLGVVLYEMLIGEPPFKGDHDQSVIHSILKKDPEPVSTRRTGISSELEEIINKALAKNTDKRYQNAEEMLADIQSLEKGLETKEVVQKVPLIKNLLKKRVPQIVGGYTIVVLIIWQSAKWLVNRFALSPLLPDFCLFALLSLIPAVAFLAYLRGRRVQGKWTKTEKILIPFNLLLSAALLFFLFYGKDLGSATKKVSYTDEKGQTVERVIPKSEFRKKVALFYFDNETGNTDWDWLQYGIVKALEMDLAQDLYLSLKSHFPRGLQGSGFEEGTGAPLALKKNIAQRQHFDFFLSGVFTRENDEFTFKTSLYETKRLKLLEERTFTGKNILDLVDEMSVRLKRDLKIPDFHIEETEDKPVSEVFTDSLAAFELSARAYYAETFKSDLAEAKTFLERAVEEDPSFAFGWSKLANAYFGLNQGEKGQEAMREAMAHDYKLSEKENFNLKYQYFFIKEDQDMVLSLAKRHVELFPDDIEGHQMLADSYGSQNQLDKALSEYELILELDPERFETLRDIASLLRGRGELDKALEYLKVYADKHPDDPRSFTDIGEIYANQGEYDLAKDFYRQALLIDPEDINILLELADVEANQGNFALAEKQYNDAIKASQKPRDLVSAYTGLRYYFEMRGQFDKAIDYMHRAETEFKKFQTPLGIILNKINFVLTYATAGKRDLALQTIEEMGGVSPPFDKLVSLGYLQLYLESEDADNLEKMLEDIEIIIKSWGMGALRSITLFAQGKIHECRGQYKEAIEDYQSSLDLGPLDSRVEEGMGRCYRILAEFEKAERILQKALRSEPINPKLNYEIAQVYWEMGKKVKALEHLNKTLQVWENADPDYTPAQIARETFAEWKNPERF